MAIQMIRRLIYITIFTLLLQTTSVIAGTTGSEELSKSRTQDSADECFEGFSRAGNTAARFGINTTAGILGVFDPAAKLGFEDQGKEDFGQTLGAWGTGSGCYFVLPVLGPTTTRDAVGLVGNIFIDPVYQITHNTEIDNGIVGNGTYSEHNYYYYRGTGAVDFRAKNIESWDSLEENSLDLYASLKSLYLQNRKKKIANSTSAVETQDDSDWEEIDTN